MSAAKEYISAARKFAAQFKGFLSIADELEKIDSFELAISEVQKRLAELRQQEADQREAHKERENVSVADAARILTQAHESAAAIRQQGETDRAAAVAQAHEIVGNAEDEAVAHQELVQAARARLAEIEQKIEELQAHHADLNVKATHKVAELERIEAARVAALAGLGFQV
jgi:vacuolar-type H+-ATPase subunit I/STV1